MVKEKRSKILLVDDDPLNILILEEILGNRYHLMKAAGADEAIAVAGRFRPDLILLDIMMPGSNGFEVCRQLRKNHHLQFTKIILVSAKTLLRDRLEGYKAGADDFISKPFDPDELMAKVRIFIRLKSVEEVDRVKDDLISLFSHETRTPMNAVIGFAKFLKESPNLCQDEREGVDLIIESATNLLLLINKTLLLSSLKEENRSMSFQNVGTEVLIQPAIEKFEQHCLDKHLTIETTILSEMILEVDVELIQTSIIYLLENAIKYTPEGGHIKIYDKQLSPLEYAIYIEDSGPGIPPARLEDLFDEFGIEDVSHHSRGHGLSLAIVKYIMENHNSHVSVQNNEPHPGATFALIFSLS